MLFVLFAGFAISPGNIWVLETGREYIIHVEIFDFKKHKILITDVSLLFSLYSVYQNSVPS